MTNEEARKIIIEERDGLKANPMVKVEDCLYEAFDLAIKALEQKQKVGKWIEQQDIHKHHYGWLYCSECGAFQMSSDGANYCSCCGTKMEVDE